MTLSTFWGRSTRFEPEADGGVPAPSLCGTVLLADDSRDNQKLLALLVAETGALLDVVDDGAQAVSAALGRHYDLILMDVRMPALGGLEATRLLRAAGHEGPILAFTCDTRPEDVDEYRCSGCSGWLAKPVAAAELFAALQAHLAAGRARALAGGWRHGDEFAALVADYLGGLRHSVVAMERCMAEGDWCAVSGLAHRMKGTAGNLGLSGISAVAGQIHGRVQGGSAALEPLLDDLRREAALAGAVVEVRPLDQEASGQIPQP